MEQMLSLEFAVLDFIRADLQSQFMDTLMAFLSQISEGGAVWLILAVCFLFDKKLRPCGIAIIAGLALGSLISTIGLKNLVGRPRPFIVRPDIELIVSPPNGYSFPSGHTLTSFIAATVIFLQNQRWGIPALILAAMIAFSRLYLYVHFPSDILAGLILGVAFGVGTWHAVHAIMRKMREAEEQTM